MHCWRNVAVSSAACCGGHSSVTTQTNLLTRLLYFRHVDNRDSNLDSGNIYFSLPIRVRTGSEEAIQPPFRNVNVILFLG